MTETFAAVIAAKKPAIGINKLPRDIIIDILRRGWLDFKAAPLFGLFFLAGSARWAAF